MYVVQAISQYIIFKFGLIMFDDKIMSRENIISQTTRRV